MTQYVRNNESNNYYVVVGTVKKENQLFTKNTAFSKHNSGCIRSESCPMKES